MESERGYRIFCDDPGAATPEIIRALDSVNCIAQRIEILSPTLEDVFFKLTGKNIKEAE